MDISDNQFENILMGMAAGDITSSLEWFLQNNAELVAEVSNYDHADTLKKLSGLLLVPHLQYFSLRVEILINVIACVARGNKKASKKDLEDWLNNFVGNSSVAMMEDPPEDVHTSSVNTAHGTFRILEGTWEGNDFFLQRILNMLQTIPKDEEIEQLERSVFGLLALSEAMANAEGGQRNASVELDNFDRVKIDSNTELNRRARAVCFSNAQLEKIGVCADALSPFICDISDPVLFEKSDLLYSPLTAAPLIRDGESKSISVVMPTAISAAIRSSCIKYIAARFGSEAFEKNLAYEYCHFFQTLSLFGDMGAVNFAPQKNKSHYMAAVAKKFDSGRYFGIVFSFDNVSRFDDEGWHSGYADEDDAEPALDELINALASQISQHEDFVRGYIFVVSCGYGRGQVLSFTPPKIEGMSYSSMSGFDLYMLSHSKGVSVQEVTKLIDHRDFFERHNYKFLNPNGFLNLYAYWQEEEKWLLPEEMGFGLQPGMLMVPTDAQLKLRVDNRRTWDEHCLYLPGEGFLTVKNKAPRPLFKEDLEYQVFAPMEVVLEGRLLGAAKSGNIVVWIEMSDFSVDPSLYSQLWDLFLNWTCRILHRLPQKTLRKSQCFHIFVDTSKLNTEIDDSPLGGDAATSCLSYSWQGDRANMELSGAFLQAFRNEGNVAERIIIDHLLSCLVDRIGLSISDESRQVLLGKVVWSEDARFFHALSARSYLDNARAFKTRDPITVEEEDMNFAKLGLAWDIIEPQEEFRLQGMEQCKPFMISLTQSIWAQLKDALLNLNKRSVIGMAMSNMLACHLEMKHWQSTNRSNYGLHKDHEDVARVIIKNTNHLTPSAMGSRVLIEMANCVCPEADGQVCSATEFAQLLSYVTLMFHYGNVSEAMRTGYIPPLVQVNKLGDVLNDLSIVDKVMHPIGEHFEREKHKSESKKYRKYYEPEEINPAINQHMPSELLQAMQAEFSATVDDMRAIRACLQNHAIKTKSDILCLRRSELVNLLKSHELVNVDVVEPVIDYFTLSPRDKWDAAPAGYSDRDWQPWKFRRRLSVLWRPFIQINMNDDPDIMISVDIYTEAFGYFFSNIRDGTFDAQWFNSAQMRKWIGKIRDEEGGKFEQAVEELIGGLRYKTRRGITLNEITQSDMAGVDYGDIDILCWSNNSDKVYVLECKNFDLAKTYSETCERLHKMRGELKSNGKADDLLKHLKRVEQVGEYVDDVRRLTGIEEPIIRSAVVFNRAAPMCYHKPETNIETDFLTFADLADYLHLG